MKTTGSPSSRWGLAAIIVAAVVMLSANHAQAQTPTVVTQTTNLTYLSTNVFQWDLNGNTSTQTTPTAVFDEVRGSSPSVRLTAAGTFAVVFGGGVDLANAFWNSNQSWVVFSGFNSGASGGSFTTLTVPGTLATFRPGASFSVGAVTNGSVTLSYTGAAYVPEPTSALAGILCLAGLLRRRR